MNPLRTLAAVAAAASLSGCWIGLDPTKVDPATVDPAKDPATFVKSLDALHARYYERCQAYDPTYVAWAIESNFGFYNMEQARSAAAGRQGYNKAAAMACLQALDKVACGGTLPACRYDLSTIMPPLVPVNGTCTEYNNSGAECVAPGTCNFGSYSAPTCPGHCLAPGTAGASCYGPNNLPGCATGYYCAGNTGLVAGTCTVNAGYHADCLNAPCAAVYFCHYDASVLPVYRCEYPVYTGGSCAGSWSCQSGAYCDATNTCRAYVAAGGACGSSGPYCDYSSNLYCDSGTNLCTPYPTTPVAIGAACSYPRFCDRTVAFCNADATPVCQAYLAQGAACTSASQCGPSGSKLCNASGHCASFAPVGGPCHTGAGECQRGIFCDAPLTAAVGTAGTCKPYGGLGATCGSPANGEYLSCMEGWCKYPASSNTGTCTRFGIAGEDCTNTPCDSAKYLDCNSISYTCQPTIYCHP